MRKAIAMAVLSLILSATGALAASPINTDNGLALQGYDPVSFFAGTEPVEGLAGITAEYEGATYRFASAKSLATFKADPASYAPAFGGYCAYGVSLGKLFPVEINTAQIIEGQLVLNKDLNVKRLFDKNRAENFAKAQAEWPGLSQ